MVAARARAGRVLGVLVVLAGVLAFGVAPAFAAFKLGEPPSFGSGPGAGPLEFGGESPGAVAVEEPTGDVFVLDAGNRRVLKVNPAGTVVLAEITASEVPGGFGGELSGVAVDNSLEAGDPSKGDVYVTDSGHEVIDKFKLEGGAYKFAGQLEAPAPAGVAVDAKGDVYAVHSFSEEVVKFGPAGEKLTPLTVHDPSAAVNFYTGIAVAPNGDLYLVGFVEGFSNRSAVKAVVGGGGEVVSVSLLDGEAQGVAVDPEGNVYVGGGGKVVEYDSSGAQMQEGGVPVEFGVGQIGSAGGLAFSSFSPSPSVSGLLYVADSTGYRVDVFAQEAAANPAPKVSGCSMASNTPVSVTVGCTVATEAAEAKWYVEYGEAPGEPGYPELSRTAEETLTGAGGEVHVELGGLTPQRKYRWRLVAANASGTTKGEEGTFQTPNAVQGLGRCSAGAVGNTTAMLTASMEPQGLSTSWFFEYGVKPAFSLRTPEESTTTLEHPEAPITGLEPHKTYDCRLVAGNTYGQTTGAAGEFTTSGPPLVGEVFAPGGPEETWVEGQESISEVGTAGARLNTMVNPEGLPGEQLPATFHYEYGTGSVSEHQTPVEALAAGHGAVAAPAQLAGLAAGTEYRFRVVASDRDGTTTGTEQVFWTFAPLFAGLPDSRAYEMVTPSENENAETEAPYSGTSTDNSGQNVEEMNGPLTPLPFQVSPDGGAVAYVGGPTAGGSGAEGAQSGNEFVARRSAAGGWAQQNITPTGAGTVKYAAFSSDLSVGILGSQEPLVPQGPGTVDQPAWYLRSGDGSLHPLAGSYAGESADGSHVLLADGYLYDSTGGGLHMVNILPRPSGEVAASATFGAPGGNAEGERGYSPNGGNAGFGSGPDYAAGPDLSHVVSADGSRIFWTDLDTGRVYVREGDARTVAVSVGPARYWTATVDGRYAFYTEGGALYAFDVERETREELADANAEVEGVIGVNNEGKDGAYVYFIAAGSLAPGAIAGQANLYLLHGGVSTFIATLAPEDIGGGGGTSGGGEGMPPYGKHAVDLMPTLGRRTAEVAPDGRSVVFMSRRSLTGYDNNLAFVVASGGTHETRVVGASEVFEYDADAGRLLCVSCSPTGEPPSEELNVDNIFAGGFVPVSWHDTYQPRLSSPDGSEVFFDSTQRLVAQDVNQNQDVYEWERDGAGGCVQPRGCVHLLSDGRSPTSSWLLGSSVSGDDVFVTTRAQLTPQDQNENYDVYDVRVGGLPTPTPPPACVGEECQSAPNVPPVFGAPTSATWMGVGNLAGSAPPVTVPVPHPKTLTRSQRLARALRDCRAKRGKHKRVLCEARARRLYGAKSRARKSDKGGRGR
jgi:sugar lactone lactonase YvrE